VTNIVLPERFVEVVHRLAAGVEPRDPVRRARHRSGLAVTLDRPALPAQLRKPVADAREWAGQLKPFDYHESCRFALRHGPLVPVPLDVRVFDASGRRRITPRRFRLPIPDWQNILAAEEDLDSPQPPVTKRSFAPALYPGAGYDLPSGVTALRGRITLAGEPLRWGRIQAERPSPNGAPAVTVGIGHGDDRGEFLLILDTSELNRNEVPNPFPIVLRIYGRTPPATPAAPSDYVRETFQHLPPIGPERNRYLRAHVADPLWDAPMEPLLVPSAGVVDPAGTGVAIPVAYSRSDAPDTAATVSHGRVTDVGSIEFVP
jgi:hypothetical protein